MIAVEIRPVQETELALLNQYMPSGCGPNTHRQRYAIQEQKKGLYLAAWHEGKPIGHALLHFLHPPHHASYPSYCGFAYVEALETHTKWRRLGVASKLMRYTERVAPEGREIGLSVGLKDDAARSFYTHLGYRSAPLFPYFVSWTFIDHATGQAGEEGEWCEFWYKL